MNAGEDSLAIRREKFIAQARTLLASDPRLVAGWLEGSLAEGTADPYSDVDLYLAARDAAADAVWAERLELIGGVKPILASADMTFAGGMRALGCLVEGPIKVDVVFLAVRDVPTYPHRFVRPLWGPAPAPEGQADLDPSPEEIRRALEPLVRMTLQGGLWPIRVLGRRQWDTFVYIELLLIETAIVPLMLLEHDQRALQYNQFSRTNRLPPAQRTEVENLANAVVVAAATRTYEALLPPHLAIYRQICRYGRAAFERYGLDFPPRLEDELIAFYQREWPRLS
jgi:hypothetical protein